MKVFITALYQNHLHNLTIPAELGRNLRRADEFIQLAVVSTYDILRTKGKGRNDIPDDCGLILGTSFGTMETNFEVLGQIVAGQQTSPITFSHSVFNAAAGYLASIFTLRGCALTVTDFSFPFFRALQEGYLALQSGRLAQCLVLQVETYSTLLQDARRRHGVDAHPWPAGVACWLLEKKEDSGESFWLDRIEINACRSDPLDFLRYSEMVECGEKRVNIHDPLGAVMAIGEEICREGCYNPMSCRIDGPWGEVRLKLYKSNGGYGGDGKR